MKKRQRKSRTGADDGGGGVPEWVVTYGDMMSLLLTFFIMLVSLSEFNVNDESFRQMLNAIRRAFGPTLSTAAVPDTSLQKTGALDKLHSQGRSREGGTKEDSRDSEGPGGKARTVDRINHGTVITLGGPAEFDRFDATLNEAIKEALDVVAELLADKAQTVVVRGHASREPLPDGWQREFGELTARDKYDLSFARARAAADYLIRQGISPRRVVVSAVGDSEPRTRTRRDDRRSSNRRVDVFLLDSYITAP